MIKKHFLLLLIVLLLNGCGYRPSSEYTKKVIKDSVYVSVKVNPQEPVNIPFIKDVMVEAVVKRFHSRVFSKKEADTIIAMDLKDVQLDPLTYDSNGFVTAYRTTVDIVIQYDGKEVRGDYFAVGEYDFSIAPNSVVSDTNKQDAIKNASASAIDSFISYLSAKGAMNR